MLTKLFKLQRNIKPNNIILCSLASIKREKNEEVIQRVLTDFNSISTNNCQDLRTKLLENYKNFNTNNVDAAFVNYCFTRQNFKLALQYINFIRNQEIKPNLLTSGQLFRLFFLRNQFTDVFSVEDEKLILDLYNSLNEQYEVLDPMTIESAIMGLSLTKQWKKGIELIESIRVISVPGNNSYNAVISAAFLHGEDEVAYKYLEELVDKDRVPMEVSFYSAIRYLKKNDIPSDILIKKLEKLLLFCQTHNIILSKKVVNFMRDLLNERKFKVKTINIEKNGKCNSCKQTLKSMEILPEQFKELKKKIIEKVIIGKNIFNRTNPAELDKFHNFIKEIENYDVVIDGLNVAYSSGTQKKVSVSSALLCSVVRYFVNQNKKVAVLGRSHMNKWPRQTWGYVEQNTKYFLTENISQDDPYLLYCALHCGPNAIIVSRDLMRSHRFLLKDAVDRKLFDRWLEQRKYELSYVSAQGIPVFKIPLPYTIISQKNKSTWHIPMALNETVENEEQQWLCTEF